MPSKIRQFLALAMCLITFFFLSACASLVKVQPWEKAHLAKPEMRFGHDVLMAKNAEQIYLSKEASSGGVGVGGGGCGCN